MSDRFRSRLATSAVLASSMAVHGWAGAQDVSREDLQLYQVEVIVFAHQAFDAAEEFFDPPRPLESAEVPQRRAPFEYEEIDLEELLRESPSSTAEPLEEDAQAAPPRPEARDEPPPFGYRLLRPEELQLGDAYATLERLSAYRPLVHTGWVQEGLPDGQAPSFELDELGLFNPGGRIQLYVSRFLHLRVDLSWQDRTRRQGATMVGPFELSELVLPTRYSLTEERRVTRTGELHYFDHPAFGLLVTIRPQERQAPPEEEEGFPRPAA